LIQLLGRTSLGLLPERRQEQVFRYLARQRSVRFVIAEGQYGAFEGALQDISIFGKYLVTGVYARHVVRILEDFFEARGGGTFIDIGAHVGLVSGALTKDPRVRVIAIEPDPTNFACLERNMRRNNRCDRVTLINQAVFNTESQLLFELSESNYGDHRIRTDANGSGDIYGESKRRTITVQADKLDAILEPLTLTGSIAVKLDIQGAEPFAFEGGLKTFAQAEIAITEFWPYSIGRMGASLERFFTDMARNFPYAKDIGHFAPDSPLDLSSLSPVSSVIASLRAGASMDPRKYTDVLLSKRPSLP
jgi:FkbM family methyltransferase